MRLFAEENRYVVRQTLLSALIVLLTSFGIAACSDDDDPDCSGDTDCEAGSMCVDGTCMEFSDADDGDDEAHALDVPGRRVVD